MAAPQPTMGDILQAFGLPQGDPSNQPTPGGVLSSYDPSVGQGAPDPDPIVDPKTGKPLSSRSTLRGAAAPSSPDQKWAQPDPSWMDQYRAENPTAAVPKEPVGDALRNAIFGSGQDLMTPIAEGPSVGNVPGAAMAAFTAVPALGEEVGAAREAAAAPAIVSRANPTPGDILQIYSKVAGTGRAGWPETANPVFATTPEAYGSTESLVPQSNIKGALPQVDTTKPLPLADRARPIAENAGPIAERIADRLAPMVKADSPLLQFYHTGPINQGLSQYAGLSPDEANQFMRDWAGQGAATSPRTQTPPNLRNASYLLYNRAAGTPVTPEAWEAAGNRPGFPMMGMHVDLADQFARGEASGLSNPKPFTFRENWSGNLSNVTADTHNIRSTLYEFDQIHPGQLPPGWFTSKEAYQAYKTGGGFPSEQALDVGAIKDTLEGSATKKVYSQTEYPVMTAPWEQAAQQLGIAPARAQSGGWFSYGPMTGLRSPPKTIPDLLNNQIGATAKELGVSPQKVLEWWGQRKIPLAAADQQQPAVG